MPRDLESNKPVPLTESPGKVPASPDPNKPTGNDTSSPEPRDASPQREFIIIPQDQQHASPQHLHPYTRPLTISDLESVVALENAAFEDPNERATREKVSLGRRGCTRDQFHGCLIQNQADVYHCLLVHLQTHQMRRALLRNLLYHRPRHRHRSTNSRNQSSSRDLPSKWRKMRLDRTYCRSQNQRPPRLRQVHGLS